MAKQNRQSPDIAATLLWNNRFCLRELVNFRAEKL
jgi:hypothetical protein